MLLRYHVVMPDHLSLSSLFTIPSACYVFIVPWSPQLCKEPTRNPRRNVSKSTWKGTGATRRLHAQHYSSEPAPEHRVVPSPNAGCSPCPRPVHCARVLCDMVRDCRRGQRQWWESPRYLQQPLDQRHNQCLPGHVREPLQAPSADIYFWPVLLSFPSGFLCRWACCQAPGTLPALQFSTAGHAVPWPGNLCSQHCF